MIPIKKDILQSPWLEKKFLVNIGVRFGTVAVVFFLFCLPSCEKTGQLKSDFNKTKQELTSARTKITQAVHLQSNRQVFLEKIRSFECRFFSADELPRLLGIISDYAAQHNLKMIASKPLDAKRDEAFKAPVASQSAGKGVSSPKSLEPASFYFPHEFELELRGGYHSLGSFLSGLKRHEKLIRVKKLVIVPGETPAEHEVRMTVAVFSMQEEGKT